MPSQINVQITGRIKDTVFYKTGDKYYSRSVPGKVKQTKATKKRATQFGKASGAGKCLRQQLLPVIPFPADNNMQTRLVSALFQWLKPTPDNLPAPSDPVPYVSTYQFTEGYTIGERWKVALAVTCSFPGTLELKIPAFVPDKSISAPANTVSVKCNISAAGCNVKNSIATGSYSTSLLFDFNDTLVPEQVISLSLPTATGTLVVTALSLEYNFVKNGHLRKSSNKAFMLAGVVSAMYF